MANQYFILALVIGATLVSGLALFVRRSSLRGTTLTHAFWWTAVSLATIVGSECLLIFSTGDNGAPVWDAAMRLIRGTITLCPAIAVLGARRPHHNAWQFIVLSMWIMLALPAWEAIFLGRFEAMDVGPVRGWFLWLIVAINLLAYVPTRFFAAAVVSTVGQISLLHPFLPGLTGYDLGGWEAAIAALLFAVVIVVTALGVPRERKTTSEFDRRWLSFRDMFGAMWGLRVIERINAASQMYDWPLSLTWSGFYFHTDGDDWETLSVKVKEELKLTLDNLLRRFV